MLFGDRHFPLRVLSRSGTQVRGCTLLCRYIDMGRLFILFLFFLVFIMSGNDPGVESLGAWDTEHLATCGTF